MDIDDDRPSVAAAPGGASASSSSSVAAVLPATLAVHVSGDASSSSRVISAAYMDSSTHRMALGHYRETAGGSAAVEAASPLRLLLEQYAPALAAARGEAVLFIDEKKVVSTERLRLNAQLTQLSDALPELVLRTGEMKHLPSAHKHVEDVKVALKSALVGGLSSHFVLVDNHTPTSVKANTLDNSLGCLYYLLERYGFTAGGGSGKAEGAGLWEISDMQLGVAAAEDQSAPVYMRLDVPAQQALNLFKSVDERTEYANLFGLLNRGRTKMSGRLLETWIKQPLTSLPDIERRHNYVEMLFNDSDLRQQLFDNHFKKMPDLDKVLKKLQDASPGPVQTTLQNVLSVYDLIDRLPTIIATLKEHQGPNAQVLQKEFIDKFEMDIIEETRSFQNMVEVTVDIPATRHHEYRIKSDVTPVLKALSEKVATAEEAVDELLHHVNNDLELDGRVRRIDLPTQGWVFRVTRKDEKNLREKRGYTVLETRKDGVYFTTKDLKDAAADLKAAVKVYDTESQKVAIQLLQVTATYLEVFGKMNSLITELDCYLALAHVAANAPTAWVRPTMLPMGSKVLKMEGARHPCLEAISSATFIPNDVDMVKGESNVQIITGPNMGGKSTYIRQTGVILVMAQLGSFVPCTSAELTVVDAVLARVGAGDMMQKGVSTFMNEMLEAASIVKLATPNSMVIIDELGRGTSTYDGFGLAWAITEHLATRTCCFTFFATHFAELTLLKLQHACIHNLFVKAHTDSNSITMMYQVEQGVSDRSFGVHVAKVANFPPEVVEMARQKARELEALGELSGNLVDRKGGDDAEVKIESSPPSSQDVPLTTFLSGSKRVSAGDGSAAAASESASAAEIGPVEPLLARLLTERPASDFQDHAGTIDEKALEQWVKSLEATTPGGGGKLSQAQQDDTAPMDV